LPVIWHLEFVILDTKHQGRAIINQTLLQSTSWSRFGVCLFGIWNFGFRPCPRLWIELTVSEELPYVVRRPHRRPERNTVTSFQKQRQADHLKVDESPDPNPALRNSFRHAIMKSFQVVWMTQGKLPMSSRFQDIVFIVNANAAMGSVRRGR